MSEQERFLIVGTGRCGSSLLSAILAHAGANFDMPRRFEWDRGSGEYEHALIIEATKWYVRANKVQNSILPSRLRDYFYRKMETTLAKLLRRATFVKSPMLVYMVPTVARLGYRPKVILIFRQFVPYSISYHRKNGLSFSDLIQKYIDVNATAVLQLFMYGGCVISYEEIVDIERYEWAEVVAHLTGLNAEAILRSRKNLVCSTSSALYSTTLTSSFSSLDPRIQSLYDLLCQLQGRIIRPIR